jgi:hypothetical protein
LIIVKYILLFGVIDLSDTLMKKKHSIHSGCDLSKGNENLNCPEIMREK